MEEKNLAFLPKRKKKQRKKNCGFKKTAKNVQVDFCLPFSSNNNSVVSVHSPKIM